MKFDLKFFFDKEWKIKLILFLVSFIYYFFYFNKVLTAPNSLLSGITGDTLKNYYTFVFHITNDSSLFHFEGMNFPYGEHIVYTDCQPLLTFILKCFPFTHNYLIGILHCIIIFSFIITPLILYSIFRHFSIPKFSSFLFALAINFLSPQLYKITSGHFGLAYGFVIPLSILLQLNLIQKTNFNSLLKLFLLNFLIFLIHPYLGFGLSIFSFVSFCTMGIIKKEMKLFYNSILIGILPTFLFKLFMFFTDTHHGRPTEPYGADALVENLSTLMAPDFGPFQKTLESIFTNKIIHYEGHSYLGLSVIIFSVLFIAFGIWNFKKLKLNREIITILFSSLLLLFISFGWHISILNFLHIKSNAVLQFRANCRFAWFFYFAFPLFLLIGINQLLQHSKTKYLVITLISVCVFILNLIEAHYFIKKDEVAFWKFKNIFSQNQLSLIERKNIDEIKNLNAQAIIPLPVYFVGSEMYNRTGGDKSMQSSIFYSFHCKLPILSTWLSRTSINETENGIELLNSYKKNRPVLKIISDKNFIVLKSNDEILPDEERLSLKINWFNTSDTLKIGLLEKEKLNEIVKSQNKISVNDKIIRSRYLLFIPFENRKPFLTSLIKNNDLITTLDTNEIEAGEYIVSLHYHYTKKVYPSVGANLLITKQHQQDFKWEYLKSVSLMSGFYNGYSVFEYKIKIEKDCSYKFAIYGNQEVEFKISSFLLRPCNTDVIRVSKGDTTMNNFSFLN